MAFDVSVVKNKWFIVALVSAVVALLALFGFGDEACNLLDMINFAPDVCKEIVQ